MICQCKRYILCYVKAGGKSSTRKASQAKIKQKNANYSGLKKIKGTYI